VEHTLHSVVEVFALVAGAVAVTGGARKLKLSAPIALVLAGLVVSWLPFTPDYTLDPALVLYLFLPPLLYSAALESSYVNFRTNLRPIGLLSVGLVLFTTVVVGLVVHALVPGIPLAAAFALGAIVAPPDAVAATAVGRSLGLPRRVLTILGGESLVNDATALTAYRVAVAAALGTGVSMLGGIGMFLLAAVGGVAVGLVLGPPLHWLRKRMTDAVLENALSLLVPFVAYLVAEEIHASGVLAVVVVGLYLGHRETETSFAARLQAHATWKSVDLVLESVVFALIGLQLPVVLAGLSHYSAPALAGWGALVTGLVIVARLAWMYPGAYLPFLLSRRIREREPLPPPRNVAVAGWAGMRGVVSLAAAFALVETFPARNLVLWLTFCVVLGTLVVQGMTLPWVIRRLGVTGDDDSRDRLAEAAVQHSAAQAAVSRLDELAGEPDDGDGSGDGGGDGAGNGAGGGRVAVPPGVVENLRSLAEKRSNAAWERLGSQHAETPAQAYKRLRREMVAAEREAFVVARNERKIDDEVLRRVMRELDLEEAMLQRD
jgi:Na+/H+ antiporter